MPVKELKDFIFKDYHQQIRFSKEKGYYLMKHQKQKDLELFKTRSTEKIADPLNLQNTFNYF